jgi:hypothetical protein
VNCLTEALLRHVAKHPVSKAAHYHLQSGGVCLGFCQTIWAKYYFRWVPVIGFDCATDDADAICALGVA